MGVRSAPLHALFLAASLGGCGDDGGMASSGNATTPADPTTGPGTAAETGTSSSGGSTTGDQSCTKSGPDCVCAAEHVTGQVRMPPADAFQCQPDLECIPSGFVSLWCMDDAGCCDGATCDPATGFCEGGDGDTSTSTSG